MLVYTFALLFAAASGRAAALHVRSTKGAAALVVDARGGGGAAAAALRERGVVVVRGSGVAVPRGAAAAAIAAVEAAVAAADGDPTAEGYESATLARRSARRYDVRLDRGRDPDGRWGRLAAAVVAAAAPVVAAASGEADWRAATAGAVTSFPGAEAQLFHADGNEDFYNCFFPLVDVPAAAGPTEFAPGTHDDPHAVCRAPTLEYDDLYEKVAPELEAGDLVIFSYATLHRGLKNGAYARPVFYVTLAPPGRDDAANWGRGAPPEPEARGS